MWAPHTSTPVEIKERLKAERSRPTPRRLPRWLRPAGGRVAGRRPGDMGRLPSSDLSPSELCILIALCRPLQPGDRASPATNREIADELFLSIPAVKRRLSVLFDRFGLQNLSHNEKRARLADLALRTGLVAPFDFMS